MPLFGVSPANNHQRPHSPRALDHVTLNIAPGEKVALCGPSGSGKTSLILTILQMVEQSGGQIAIDDVDLSMIGGHNIRSHLNVVPQDPFFMPGTLRFNLDPHSRSSTQSVEAAIRMVGLWDKVSSSNTSNNSSSALDRELNGVEWSQGERQLLCLARALLHPSKVVILDECTSRYAISLCILLSFVTSYASGVYWQANLSFHSVDEHTEAIMQNVIDTEFHDRTTISILHRFKYIDRFDRVAVLRHGRLVECDAPQALLSRQSAFRDLYSKQNYTRASPEKEGHSG